MARPLMIPAALIAALAFGSLPVLAQDTAPATDTAAPMAKRVKPAEIRLDFGAGRKVGISCGEATIEACIASAMPLIEKVAATPPVEHAKGMMGQHRGWGKKGDKGPGRDGGPKGEGRDMPGADAPPPPPAEAPAN